MHIEPTELPNEDDGLDAAADELLAQMDAGIAKADEVTPPAPEPALSTDEGDKKDEADLVDETAKPEDAKLEGDDATSPGDKPAEGAKPGEEGTKDEPAKDQAIEDEIAGFKLGEKASERFRNMAAEIKELAPYKEELTKLGIGSVADLPALAQRAQIGADMVSMVQETGANAEQYGMTLDYLGLITAAGNGDLKAAERAYAIWEKEGQALAAMLGKDVPGVFDPLAHHPDLTEAVKSGDVTRAYALELAKQRAQGVLHQDVAKRTREQQAEAQRQTEQQEAHRLGVEALRRFDAEMAADANYAAKRPFLNAMVTNIRSTKHPSEWEAATRAAYASLPAITPPAAKPPPGPVRASGPRAVMVPEFDDPMAALDAGINVASQ